DVVPARIPPSLAEPMRRAALALVCLQASAALAQSPPDDDLGRIPSESPSVAPSGPSRLHRKVHLEGATETGLLRSTQEVPTPPPAPATIEQRLLTDARLEWIPLNQVSINFSARAGLRVADDISFPTHENVRADLRELFASWRPLEGVFFDV